MIMKYGWQLARDVKEHVTIRIQKYATRSRDQDVSVNLDMLEIFLENVLK